MLLRRSKHRSHCAVALLPQKKCLKWPPKQTIGHVRLSYIRRQVSKRAPSGSIVPFVLVSFYFIMITCCTLVSPYNRLFWKWCEMATDRLIHYCSVYYSVISIATISWWRLRNSCSVANTSQSCDTVCIARPLRGRRSVVQTGAGRFGEDKWPRSSGCGYNAKHSCASLSVPLISISYCGRVRAN